MIESILTLSGWKVNILNMDKSFKTIVLMAHIVWLVLFVFQGISLFFIIDNLFFWGGIFLSSNYALFVVYKCMLDIVSRKILIFKEKVKATFVFGVISCFYLLPIGIFILQGYSDDDFSFSVYIRNGYFFLFFSIVFILTFLSTVNFVLIANNSNFYRKFLYEYTK